MSAVALAGCMTTEKPPEQPSFYNSMASAEAQVDAAAAASMISGYRANNGLGAVTIDPRLMQIAETQARAMAAHDKVERSAGSAAAARLKRSGYGAAAAAENMSAGYHTLAEAFSGWRDSPPHRATMLLPAATRMGIAAAYAPGSKYKVFWTLILARPEQG